MHWIYSLLQFVYKFGYNFSSQVQTSFIFMATITIFSEFQRPKIKSDTVPDFRGKAFNFWPLKILFAQVFSYMAFIVLRYAPFMPAFWRIIISKCWILSNTFSVSIEVIVWFLIFEFNMVYHMDWLICKYYNPCSPWMRPMCL